MSFEVAVTGMNAATADLEVISNNIANSNTNGFKRSRAEFADVYAASDLGVSKNSTGEGVRVTNVRQQFTQGEVNFTENNLDLAISGGGFFRLNDSTGGIVFSRAGTFGMDREGYLINASEQRLTGYQSNEKGKILPTLGQMKIDTSDLTPKASENISLGANLSLGAEPLPTDPPFDHTKANTYTFSTAATVYDSQGASHVVDMYFIKNAQNVWTNYMYIGEEEITGNNAITFKTDGTLDQINGGASPIVEIEGIGIPNAAPMNLNIDFSQLTQFDNASGTNQVSVDGYGSGRLATLDVDSTGIIYGRYNNGQSYAMGQLALANFSNIEALRPVGNTSWAETFGSGQPALGAPGSASLGNIQSSALEQSNVDITKELVDMIASQRNFQANAQVVSVADTLTQTIINIRR
jgi:flagellar hook protein FlgE